MTRTIKFFVAMSALVLAAGCSCNKEDATTTETAPATEAAPVETVPTEEAVPTEDAPADTVTTPEAAE